MPGTAIPVISPAELTARRPDEVAVFVSDLMTEVRAAYPEIEASGGRWVDADALGSARTSSRPVTASRLRAARAAGQGSALWSGRCCRPEARARRISRHRTRVDPPSAFPSAAASAGGGASSPLAPLRRARRRAAPRRPAAHAATGPSNESSLMHQHQPLARRQQPQALVPGRRRKPGAHPIRHARSGRCARSAASTSSGRCRPHRSRRA